MKKTLAMCLVAMFVFSCFGSAALAEGTVSELNVAIGAQFTTLDPALNTEVVNNYAINHMYAGLFEADENNAAQNELCESYTVSEDGLKYVFTMVKGAKWSDGVEITAKDFEYSYLRALSFGADNAWAANDLVTYIVGGAEYNEAALEKGAEFDLKVEDHSYVGVKATDDYTLELTLCKPCAYFTKLLCGNVWTAVREDFAPQHESLWAFEPGYPTSGAYTLVECNENEICTLAKSSSYFKADTITVDTINWIVMTDSNAKALAFQTGEIDIAISISSETATQYEGTENLWIVPNSSNYFLAINSASTGPEWAKNVNIRRALALAIDKEAVVDVLGGSSLYPTLNGYVPNGLRGISGDFREEGDADGFTLTYDPDQAKALLAEAGYTAENPLTIAYKYSNNFIHGDVATMLQSMWQAVGINVELLAVESGVFYDQLDAGDFEIARYGYTASNDAMDYLQLWTTGKQIVAAVDDPAYDEMVDKAGYIIDTTEYYTELHAIEDYLCEQNVYVIPMFNFATPALVQGVSGYTTHGGSVYLGNVTAE